MIKRIDQLPAIQELYAIVDPYKRSQLDAWIQRNVQSFHIMRLTSREMPEHIKGDMAKYEQYNDEVGTNQICQTILSQKYVHKSSRTNDLGTETILSIFVIYPENKND